MKIFLIDLEKALLQAKIFLKPTGSLVTIIKFIQEKYIAMINEDASEYEDNLGNALQPQMALLKLCFKLSEPVLKMQDEARNYLVL
jgi:hypothetical protein